MHDGWGGASVKVENALALIKHEIEYKFSLSADDVIMTEHGIVCNTSPITDFIVAFDMDRKTDLSVEMILIDADRRGQGVATSLMKTVCGCCDHFGVSLSLCVTPLGLMSTQEYEARSQRLIRFYERFGFEKRSGNLMIRSAVLPSDPTFGMS